jgi:uncharacterized Zn finger protein
MTATAASPSPVAHKAARLHADGHVTEVPQMRVFRVQGDHGVYRVTLSRDGLDARCNCPAYGVCSHIGAALLAAGLVE